MESLQVAEEEVEEVEEVEESSSNKLSVIYTYVTKGSFPHTMNPLRKKNLKRYARKFIIDESKLYYVGSQNEIKREVVIEAEKKRQIFLDCHFNELGHHLGQKKTVNRIQSKYYWLGIIRDVVDWIKVCETCQHTERNKILSRTVRPIKVDAPWEILGIDFLGPFPVTPRGNVNAVVVIDYFTKWPEAFPVQKMDVLSVARCISTCIYRFGAPKTIVCMQNASFCDEVTKLLFDKWSIVQKVSALERPQLNPLHDCTSHLLKEAIVQMVSEKQTEWDDFLDHVLFVLRMSSNPTTKFTPYSLMFNRTGNLTDETGSRLLNYEDQQKEKSSPKDKSSTHKPKNSVKQLVIANMNASYKQDKKKTTKRRIRIPSMNFKIEDSLFCAGDSPSPKKSKDSLYLAFPVETALATEQSSDHMKNELVYHLRESEDH